jgi:hypothetical protein
MPKSEWLDSKTGTSAPDVTSSFFISKDRKVGFVLFFNTP